jgi:hypothetical protein
MRPAFLMAGATALALCGPALANPPIAASGPAVTAQAQAPATPSVVNTPDATIIIAPKAPPAPEAETPPPSPSPSFVWEPGHWAWTGTAFDWQPGKYVEKPTVTATYTPGHWQQGPEGWAWVDGSWDYAGVGSSTPPPPRP